MNGVQGLGRTLEISYPWKGKLTADIACFFATVTARVEALKLPPDLTRPCSSRSSPRCTSSAPPRRRDDRRRAQLWVCTRSPVSSKPSCACPCRRGPARPTTAPAKTCLSDAGRGLTTVAGMMNKAAGGSKLGWSTIFGKHALIEAMYSGCNGTDAKFPLKDSGTRLTQVLALQRIGLQGRESFG